jgi:hypothetical protein
LASARATNPALIEAQCNDARGLGALSSQLTNGLDDDRSEVGHARRPVSARAPWGRLGVYGSLMGFCDRRIGLQHGSSMARRSGLPGRGYFTRRGFAVHCGGLRFVGALAATVPTVMFVAQLQLAANRRLGGLELSPFNGLN